jgi:hypothetical protein
MAPDIESPHRTESAALQEMRGCTSEFRASFVLYYTSCSIVSAFVEDRQGAAALCRNLFTTSALRPIISGDLTVPELPPDTG